MLRDIHEPGERLSSKANHDMLVLTVWTTEYHPLATATIVQRIMTEMIGVYGSLLRDRSQLQEGS
jgi:hypothetical protein